MSRKITAMIVDDEAAAIDHLKKQANDIERLVIVKTFTNPRAALSYLRSHHVDLILLDVEMEPISGIRFLAQMPNKDIKVVLVSGHEKYAVDGFDYQVVDYLLKKVSFERLSTAIGRVEKALGRSNFQTPDHPDDYFYFFIKGPTRHERTKIKGVDIVYIESLNGRTYFHLQQKDKPLKSKTPLKEVLEVLPAARFKRIHRSYVINIEFFNNYLNGTVVMRYPNTVLPVGKKEKYPDFFEWLDRYSL